MVLKSFFLPIAAALLLAASPCLAAQPGEAAPPHSRSHVHWYVAGAGMLLMAGGGAFAYFQNREADRAMATYRKSAFTENTVELRGTVKEHERLTWAGLAGAALGGILVAVSF